MQITEKRILSQIKDGPSSLEELYGIYDRLQRFGWEKELLFEQGGETGERPIFGWRSPQQGPSLGLLAGIHGNEKAGPTALAFLIEQLGQWGKERAILAILLASPLAYAENTYYPYPEISVGDCSHFAGLRKQPACPEVLALTDFFKRYRRTHPLERVFDFHEYHFGWLKNTVSGLFFYGHGEEEQFLPEALRILQGLKDEGEEILYEGETQEGELIREGVIRDPLDYSLDWWLAKCYRVPLVLVLETDTRQAFSKRVSLAQRVLRFALAEE